MSAKAIVRSLLPKNRFARSVSILAGGTAVGQGIVILASPLLTRLYGPEDFGLLAVYTALLGITTVVSSLRYQLAIPLPESDEEAAHVVALSLLVVLGMALLTALATFLFRHTIAEALNAPALADFLWLLPVGVLLTGIYQVFNYWAIRTGAFSAVARTKLMQGFSMVGVQLAGFTLGPLALLLGQVTGHAAGVTGLGTLAVRQRWNVFKRVRLPGIGQAARRYKHFPLFSTWGSVFNAVGQQLPFLLLAALFSSGAAGVYLLAQRVLTAPMGLIGKGIADVFFSSAAEARRNGVLGDLVADIHEKLAHIAMPPTLILALAGPEIFAIAFGQEWRQAGLFAQWMAPWGYLVLVTSPLSTLFSVLEKQFHEMLFQGLLLGTRLVALLFGAYLGDVLIAVALFSLSSAACYLVFLIWLMRASGNDWTASWAGTARALVWSAFSVSPLLVLYTSTDDSFLWSAAFGLTGLMVASRYLFLMKRAWQ
ncbi:oligosaccharide flippase family protein [Thiohalomonas denitrificans]|uniref:oligosaccharide flippase family protein n=1 Tax=Thiohalomonas denitrificans TaxID=415747 RepID=UPI0026F2DFB6|nr:oligosaccharide flippase family protein [Thiohalomonas denitrificans]